MQINTIEKRLLYVPNKLKGISTFDGKAYTSDDLSKYINEQDVKFMVNKLLGFVEVREEMFGQSDEYGRYSPEEYGLFFRQLFYDLKNRILIQIEEIKEIKSHDFMIKPVGKFLQNSSNIGAHDLITSGKIIRSINIENDCF